MLDVKNPDKPPVAVSGKALLIALLIFAALLRVWIFPSRGEIRDGDEMMYMTSGLVAWEGLLPGPRAVPAGPQTWIGWLYVAGRSGWEMLHPLRAAGMPAMMKPYLAIDRALFSTYEDLGGLRNLMLWTSLGIALAGVYGGYRLGSRYGGAAGGLLIGGLVAALPLFVEYSAITKSCSDAWMLGILAVSCAATLPGTKPRWLPGIVLGLAIGSRIDMVLLAPLVLWGLWDHHGSEGLWRRALTTAAATVLTVFISAPWAVLGFVGLLRNTVMVRGVGYGAAGPWRLKTLAELVWWQGLGPVLLVTLIGFLVSPTGTRLKRGSLAAFAALMAATMFTGSYAFFRYHGGPLIALLTAAGVAAGALLQRWPRPAAMAMAALLLVLPVAQSVRGAQVWKSLYAPETCEQWIDEHIPAGTVVYLHAGYDARAVLPTEAAADAIWHVVAGDQAWRTKLEDGFRRFSVPKQDLPRAMSEDNLCTDRSAYRRWFILGGGRSSRPRYLVRPVAMGATFGLPRAAMVEEFKRTGGVVVWRTAATGMPEGLGEPWVKWLNRNGEGTMLFVSPDLRDKLK